MRYFEKVITKSLTNEKGKVYGFSMSYRRDKRPVTVFLSEEDFDRLAAICEEKGISRADFMRNAIEAADRIPSKKTRPLTGICLERHEAKLEREGEK